MGPSLGGNLLWVSLFLYLETFSLFFRPSQNPTNYIYSCAARRDKSIGITFRVFGDGRFFSKKFLSIENQSELPPGEGPTENDLQSRPSPNTLKVPPNDSSRRALQVLLKKNWIREKKFFCSPHGEEPAPEYRKKSIISKHTKSTTKRLVSASWFWIYIVCWVLRWSIFFEKIF